MTHITATIEVNTDTLERILTDWGNANLFCGAKERMICYSIRDRYGSTELKFECESENTQRLADQAKSDAEYEAEKVAAKKTDVLPLAEAQEYLQVGGRGEPAGQDTTDF